MTIGKTRTLAVAAAIVAAAAVVSLRNTYDPDLWWHLAQGREDAAGRLVRTNVFSFNYPEYRQHYTTWLFDTVAYAGWTFAGGLGIQLLETLLVALTFWLLLIACRARAPAAATFAVLVVGLFVVEPRVLPRPYLVSFAGLAFCTLCIERAMARGAAAPLLFTIPAITLWSNFHVECVFGVALLGVFALSELVRPAALPRREALRAVAIAALCGMATLVNPYGIGLLQYLYENTSVPRILDIAELRPPYLPAYRAFFVYLIAAAVLLVSQPRSIRLWEIATAALFAAMGLRYLRLTPLLFIVTAPMVSARIGVWMSRGLDRRAVIITALVAGIFISRVPVTSFASGLRAGSQAIMPPAFFSPGATAFARAQGLRGPLFNSNNLGGFIAWMLYPDARIFQDGRLQAYPPEHFRAIVEGAGSPADWDRLVAGVDWAMLSIPHPYSLSGAGQFPEDEWVVVYRDKAVEILVRRRVVSRQPSAVRQKR